MHRLRRFRRVPRSTIALITLAAVLLVIAYLVPGSKPRVVHVGRQYGVPVDRTGWNDYLRAGLWVAAALVLGYGAYRWNAASEAPLDESDARPRAFGDSVVDQYTQVDPAIGIRPVDMTRDR
jgi:hypothetical protein